MSAATVHTLSFSVPGVVPSKSNFRRGKDWRRRWTRIKAYEEEVGYAALEAGAAHALGRHGGKPVRVELAAFNQPGNLDLDGMWKILLDAVEGVCIENDRQVRSHEGARASDGGGPRIRLTVRYLEGKE